MHHLPACSGVLGEAIALVMCMWGRTRLRARIREEREEEGGDKRVENAGTRCSQTPGEVAPEMGYKSFKMLAGSLVAGDISSEHLTGVLRTALCGGREDDIGSDLSRKDGG